MKTVQRIGIPLYSHLNLIQEGNLEIAGHIVIKAASILEKGLLIPSWPGIYVIIAERQAKLMAGGFLGELRLYYFSRKSSGVGASGAFRGPSRVGRISHMRGFSDFSCLHQIIA